MPIDPRIALGYQAPQLESPVNMMMMAQKMQAGQQENQLRQAQMENYQAEATRRNELLPYERDKLIREAKAAKVTELKSQSDLLDSKLKQSRSFLDTIDPNDPNAPSAFLAWHQANHDDLIIGPALQARGVTVDSARAQIDAAMAQPGGFAKLLAQSKLGAEKFAENTRLEATAAETNRHNLKMEGISVSREDRLANAGISTQTHPLLSQAVLDGRVPLTRVNSRSAKLFEDILKIDPDADLNEINLSQISGGAGARTAGTVSANIAIASDEARRMIDVTRQFISAVNPTDFPSLNAIKNAVQKGTGDENIVRLNTSLNALINSYARAINPRGQPTVSDKNHARDIINSAMAKGQLNAALGVMELEMDNALAAANAAKGGRGPAGGETPAVGTPQGIPSGDAIAAEIARRKAGKK
jgi:hypothetical protein